ncbi:hypothetical protein [Aquimarina sediminis]|uniref:hypothetical protein n=1 Tax=Aquimarina sediminis TaxID=2070536 RepID=UPI000CA0385F|nr:hypothetical protein [Aquimarina sediminis]
MKFKNPIPITCKSCDYKGKYKIVLLLNYEAKCDKCKSNFDYASAHMNKLMEDLNETYLLLEVILGIEEHFEQEYQGGEIENIKSIQDLLTVTENEFDNEKEQIRKKLLAYLRKKYNTKIKEFDTSILTALGIEVKKRDN